MNATTLDNLREAAAAVDALLRAWRYKPLRWSIAPDAPELHALISHRVRELLQRRDTAAWAISGMTRIAALGVLQSLEWDTNVLGMAAGRLHLVAVGGYSERVTGLRPLVAAAIARARHAGLRHISIRVDVEDDAAVHVLEESGFLLVDALTTFEGDSTAIALRTTASAGLIIRPASNEDAPEVESIAAVSFTDGRFHSDPSIPPQIAANVYRTWAANCCRRCAADETIVAIDRGRVAGFVATRIEPDTATILKRATGTIVLVATAPEARGRGVGAQLVSAAAEWFRTRGATVMDVGTQLRNIRAGRLYERCGCRLVAGTLSFRTIVTP